MKTKISFGKVDGYGNGRKSCEITLEVELRDTDKGPEFSVCGNLWNNIHTDIIWGGQCVDDLFWKFGKQMQNPKLYAEILELWKKYHLNGMHAGTEEQEDYLDQYKSEHPNWRYDYSEACIILKCAGLYEVEVDGKPYQYGHGWLYREIPEVSLNRIKKIIEIYHL